MSFLFLKTLSSLAEAPEWFKIFPKGEVEIADAKPAMMDETAAKMIIARWNALKRDLVVDYEHQTLTGQKAPAAGWIKALEWREDGLWGKADWTADGAAYLAKQEYRYFSPVFMVNKKDRRITELYNIALTNQPRMMGITPLVGKQEEGEIMNPEMVDKIKKALGVSEDADILAAIEALVAAKDAVPKEVQEALKLTGATVSSVVAEIHALKQGQQGMVTRAEYEALVLKLAGKEADDAVTDALQKGKITPAQKEWATGYAKRDLPGFQIFVAKAPVVVPVGPPPQVPGPQTEAIDDAVLAVAAKMGVNPEDIKKYGGVK